MINVFISHNYKDKPMARKIAKELDKYGIKVWLDESEIKLGDSLIEKIRDGLDHMDYLIALISENSVHSEWVKKELDIAMNKEIDGRKVIAIPILVGKCELPGFLKGKLYADMSTSRKYNENIPVLIRRFDINEIEDDKNEFTEYKLSAAQVIEKIENIKNENETIEFIESFGYSERTLFYRDTFIQAINILLEDEKTPVDLLVSLIEMCSYCPNDAVIKLSLTQLLNRTDEQILQSTINVLRKTKSLKIQQKKILKILKECRDNDLERCIWDYFASVKQLDFDVAKKLWEFIRENLNANYSNNMIKCMCKLHTHLGDDSIFEEWYMQWSEGDEKRKRDLVNCMYQYGFGPEEMYLVSPKLRDIIREVLFNSFGENDTDNANLMIALLTGAGNLVESNVEIWNKLKELDDYSILLTLEILNNEYNIAYIFDSIEDIDALKDFVKSPNRNIKKVALEAIAEINLKESLEIINAESDFNIQYYNASSLLYTLIKESDVKEYEKLFEKIKEKLENGYCGQADRNLICYGDYLLGNIDLCNMIEKLQIKDENIGYQYERKKKLLIEKIKDLLPQGDKSTKKKISELINAAKV